MPERKQTRIELYSNKLEGKALQLMPDDRRRYEEFVKQLPPGCFKLIIEKAVKEKSDRQRKMIFGHMIESTIVQANDLGIDVSAFLKYLLADYEPKGQGLTKDFLHELMYVICPTTDENGRRITLSRMDTQQAAALFDRFRNIVAPLGIVINDPDPNWRTQK